MNGFDENANDAHRPPLKDTKYNVKKPDGPSTRNQGPSQRDPRLLVRYIYDFMRYISQQTVGSNENISFTFEKKL